MLLSSAMYTLPLLTIVIGAAIFADFAKYPNLWDVIQKLLNTLIRPTISVRIQRGSRAFTPPPHPFVSC